MAPALWGLVLPKNGGAPKYALIVSDEGVEYVMPAGETPPPPVDASAIPSYRDRLLSAVIDLDTEELVRTRSVADVADARTAAQADLAKPPLIRTTRELSNLRHVADAHDQWVKDNAEAYDPAHAPEHPDYGVWHVDFSANPEAQGEFIQAVHSILEQE